MSVSFYEGRTIGLNLYQNTLPYWEQDNLNRSLVNKFPHSEKMPDLVINQELIMVNHLNKAEMVTSNRVQSLPDDTLEKIREYLDYSILSDGEFQKVLQRLDHKFFKLYSFQAVLPCRHRHEAVLDAAQPQAVPMRDDYNMPVQDINGDYLIPSIDESNRLTLEPSHDYSFHFNSFDLGSNAINIAPRLANITSQIELFKRLQRESNNDYEITNGDRNFREDWLDATSTDPFDFALGLHSYNKKGIQQTAIKRCFTGAIKKVVRLDLLKMKEELPEFTNEIFRVGAEFVRRVFFRKSSDNSFFISFLMYIYPTPKEFQNFRHDIKYLRQIEEQRDSSMRDIPALESSHEAEQRDRAESELRATVQEQQHHEFHNSLDRLAEQQPYTLTNTFFGPIRKARQFILKLKPY